MANVKFYSVKLKSTYNALEVKDNLALYWINETSELYKGDKLFGTGALATQAAAGLLSAEDKARLDALVAASDKMNLSAVDNTIVLTDTADGKGIGVAVSAQPGNALLTVDDGLFVPVSQDVVIPEYTVEKQEVAEDGYIASYRLKKTVGDVSTYLGDIINISQGQGNNAIEVVDSISNLPTVVDAVNDKLYYAKAENVFCFVHEGAWQYVNSNNGEIDDFHAIIGNIPDGITIAEMLENTQRLAGDAMMKAENKVTSITSADQSVTISGNPTEPMMAVKISADVDNVLTLTHDGLKVAVSASTDAAEYSIVQSENSGDYAAVYNLTKNGAIVGATINIPKSMIIQRGFVADGNIVLILNDEANTEIIIPADSLIEYVTSGSQAGDVVVVTVSDDHKVTATITDGSIGLDKLAIDVAAKIQQAHNHANAEVLASITADRIAVWEATQSDSEAIAAVKAELEAKIAEAKLEAIATAATDAANKDIVILAEAQKGSNPGQADFDIHTTNTEIHITADERTAWNTAEQNAKDYADGLSNSLISQLTWGEF